MIFESLLAYAHLMAVLSWVVFATSTTVLIRAEVFDAKLLERLVRVDAISLVAGVVTLLTGLARAGWGVKGAAWYAAQPLLWAKLALLLLMLAGGLGATLRMRRWRRDWLARAVMPDAASLVALRWHLMATTHLMLVPPLLGALLARGVGTV